MTGLSAPAVNPAGGLFVLDQAVDQSASQDEQNNETRDVEVCGSGDSGPKLQDQTNLLPFKQLMIVFSGLSAAIFCSMLDQTIVSTALPTLGRDFNASSYSSWIGTSYLLTSTVCLPLYGRLSDIFGRKTILTAALCIFLLGSILCSISQNMTMLIVFRALQGIGGGGILTTIQTVVADVVTLKQRGTYEGILGAVASIANAMGPLLGGVFTEKASWRWCFYINIPLSTVTILIVWRGLPLKNVHGEIAQKLAQIDYTGGILMLASTILILLPISWGRTTYNWNSPGVLCPLIIGAFLLVPLVYVEARVAKLPILPASIFKNGTVFGVLFGSFFTGFVFYASLYYLPQFYQVVRGASPVTSGILIVPLIVSQTLTSLTSGLLTSKTGDYLVQMNLGYLIWTISCGLLSLITPTISSATMVGFQLLSGIGAGSTIMTGLIAIQASLPRHEMAVATSARDFLRLLGGTIALSASAAILNNSLKSELLAVLPESTVQIIVSDPTKIKSADLELTASQRAQTLIAYTHGLRNIFYFMIPCCVISFFISWFFVKGQKTLRRQDDEKLKAEGKAWAYNRRPRNKKKRDADIRTNLVNIELEQVSVDHATMPADSSRCHTLSSTP